MQVCGMMNLHREANDILRGKPSPPRCLGGIRSSASTVAEIIDELKVCRRSERENRVIDHDQEASMELKKREGYF